MRGDRTATEVKGLTRQRDILASQIQQQLKEYDRQRTSLRRQREEILATTPKEVEQQLQEVMSVMRSCSEQIQLLADVLKR